MSHRTTTDWKLTYHEWVPDEQPLREALCALGNGYFVTRGAFEEATAGGPHYPGTYMAGGYNRLETEIAGHVVENEDLVNWPNWLGLNFRAEGGKWFSLDAVQILEFRFELDVYRGLLEREVRFRDADEREFTLLSRRLVHMKMSHLAGIQWMLTAHNWSGTIEIESTIDGRVKNDGVQRYRALNSQHLEVLDTQAVAEDTICLTCKTVQSHIRVCQTARTRVYRDDVRAAAERCTDSQPGHIAQYIKVDCERSKPLRIDKIVAFRSSYDHAISEPTIAACNTIRRAADFSTMLRSHELSWSHLWGHADLDLQDSSAEAQFILRLHIFHLLQTTSVNTIDRDAGVPSRGWHGEAYRGHIFWDELFIFPFLNLRIPELTRSLLTYRFRRMHAARDLAREAGFAGAMFPWQSGSDGREESQRLHLNPKSGRWVPDVSNLQRHVNSAIAYNVWQYYQATRDMEFLSFYGAQMLLEISRFWSSIAQYNAERDRYEIRGVMGPDEFHTAYPDADEPGLNNNAYTNVMVVWVLQHTLEVLDLVGEDRRRELVENLAITDDEPSRWEEISRKMFVPFHDDGIISQFEGYEKLEEFDWEGYRANYGDIHRLDRILEAEGDSVNRYKASKQADALMLMYLFSADELTGLLGRLGYEFSGEQLSRNIGYYLHRTSHGSTLSGVVHSWVLARSDRKRAWNLFERALRSDIDDIQGGTTPEGIHLGAMAGTVDLIQRGHMGIEMREGVLWFNPQLPDAISQIRMRLRYRGHWLSVHAGRDKLIVSFDRGWSESVRIGFKGNVYEMAQGDRHEFDMKV